jgi:DMSO/TMAO reductase YedYZ molybdopterin-dependent catalytic subunit
MSCTEYRLCSVFLKDFGKLECLCVCISKDCSAMVVPNLIHAVHKPLTAAALVPYIVVQRIWVEVIDASLEHARQLKLEKLVQAWLLEVDTVLSCWNGWSSMRGGYPH